MTIRVKPEYLPYGFEDRTNVNIGVKKFRDGPEDFIKVFLWRSETEVCESHYGARIVKKKFQSETEMVNIEVNIPDLIVISSEFDFFAKDFLGKPSEKNCKIYDIL